MSTAYEPASTALGAGQSPHLARCIEDCLECHQVCLATVMNCLSLGGEHATPAHITTLLDCADICQTSASFMIRQSPRHALTCTTCAEICEQCARECERFTNDFMRLCAEVCRRCASSCKEMATHSQAALAEQRSA